MTKNDRNLSPNHYEVLGLADGLQDQISQDIIKAAYRKALLQHHPDKSSLQHRDNDIARLSKSVKLQYTVDEISLAQKVLADPIARAEYDRQLRLANTRSVAGIKESTVHAGIEALDLEDLDFDEGTSMWYHSCRCGNAKGYRISEEQLERETRHGEVYVGCEGCSLWIRVLFEVEESPGG